MSGLTERIASRRGAPQDPAALEDSVAPAPDVAVAPDVAAETDVAAEPSVAPGAPAAAPEAPAAAPEAPGEPGFLARSRMRRRLRYLRRLREVQLRDIGGFVVELHRFGEERPHLLQAKVAWAAQTDMELRALERALGESHPMREIREPGIGGACAQCGAVHGSQDRYCATCGEPLATPADAGDPGAASA